MSENKQAEPVARVIADKFDDGSHKGHILEWLGRNEANDFPEGTEFYTHPAPAVAQEPVGFRYKTRSIKYPENGWSGWHFQEGVPANYHLTDDGNFEFLTRLLYDHSTPDVAPTEVVRELVEALEHVQKVLKYPCNHWHIFNPQQGGLDQKIINAALKSAKEHGL